jgi:hypothetical protein
MKKISYYVAAFALCCGVSQTLTSCIEETEEPDDVKALRQAEIARVNADAEYKKAQAASETADAAKTNAEVDGVKIDNAIKELQKALREGTQADSIAYYAAAVQSEIKKMKNSDITQAKTLAVTLLPAKLNASCPSYGRYLEAAAKLNGGVYTDIYGNSTTVEKADSKAQKLADAKEKLDNGVEELEAHLNYLAELQTNVAAAEQAQKATNKLYEKQKKAYEDKETSTCYAADESDFQGWDGTFDASDNDTRADNWSKAGIVWTYLKALDENAVKEAKDELALATDNKKFATGSEYKKLVEAYNNAKANYDIQLAEYEEAKALYEAELEALQAVK